MIFKLLTKYTESIWLDLNKKNWKSFLTCVKTHLQWATNESALKILSWSLKKCSTKGSVKGLDLDLDPKWNCWIGSGSRSMFSKRIGSGSRSYIWGFSKSLIHAISPIISLHCCCPAKGGPAKGGPKHLKKEFLLPPYFLPAKCKLRNKPNLSSKMHLLHQILS